jgi:hypothetical protein
MENTKVPVTKKFFKVYGVNISRFDLMMLSGMKRFHLKFYKVKGVDRINPESWQKFERKLIKVEIGQEIKEEIKKGVKELANNLINEAFQEIKREVIEKEIKKIKTHYQ